MLRIVIKVYSKRLQYQELSSIDPILQHFTVQKVRLQVSSSHFSSIAHLPRLVTQIDPRQTQPVSTNDGQSLASQIRTMADDASYTAFLNRANEDVGTSGSKPDDVPSTSQSKGRFDPTTSSSSSGVPKPLTEISATYVSDTDSDFEPVFFSYSGDDLPSVEEFQQCLGAKGQHAKVEELTEKEFDVQGQYKDVIAKVKQVGSSKGVKIFRVEIDKTRVEYYIVTVGERKLLGVMAKAVES